MKPRLMQNLVHADARGDFIRMFDKEKSLLPDLQLMQINISKNPISRTLRGMHFQVAGPPEHKLVSVICGKIQLVVSNAHRVNCKSQIENHYFNLSEGSSETLFVPSGLATGWISLSDDVIISYLMTSRYENCEYSGFRFDDPLANISWASKPDVISEKDRNWPSLR